MARPISPQRSTPMTVGVRRCGRIASSEPERFGTADFYGWSEDKARQYASPQRAGFGAFVRKQGFVLE